MSKELAKKGLTEAEKRQIEKQVEEDHKLVGEYLKKINREVEGQK